MIKEEFLEINGKKLVKHYSEEYMIKQVETDILYAEAIDVVPCKYTYVETNELIEVEQE